MVLCSHLSKSLPDPYKSHRTCELVEEKTVSMSFNQLTKTRFACKGDFRTINGIYIIRNEMVLKDIL